MEAPALRAPQGDTLVADEAFDPAIGSPERLAPDHAPSATACGRHLHCVPQ
jgi:hypothetical protein